MQKPSVNEHAPYFSRYISLVKEGYFYTELDESLKDCLLLFGNLTAEQAEFRYAEDKWTPKEILMHIMDTERIFVYRALSISRGEQASLLGFDENLYAASIDVSNRSITDLLEELKAIRQATKLFFQHLPAKNAAIIGTANHYPTSPRAIAYMIIGHVIHHCNILKERYL